LDGGAPDEQLDLHRFRELLRDRLDSLAGWQAEIFEMRHFENLSIPEISERTARSSDAVRSSLYRVKRLFFEAAVANGALPATGGDRP
jgi:DNA-directed RNA polymerase specialized sigma24 family protein